MKLAVYFKGKLQKVLYGTNDYDMPVHTEEELVKLQQQYGHNEHTQTVLLRDNVDITQEFRQLPLQPHEIAELPPKDAAVFPVGIPKPIEKTIAENMDKYGSFSGHSRITQAIKLTMQTSLNWQKLSEDKREALDMIAHKIGRILNGSSDLKANWQGIVGYAKLIADRLEDKNG